MSVSTDISKYIGSATKIADIWGNIIINVKAAPYLAKGDGVTNDTAAIQAAINYAISVGKHEIVFPAGTYVYGTLTNTTGIVAYVDGAVLSGGTVLAQTSVAALQADVVQRGVNIMDAPYNAVGGGVVDDADAINAAITAVYDAGGGTVIIPSNKTFGFASPIIFKSNVTLLGMNKDTSILKVLANEANIQAHDVSHIVLDNFTLDCNNKKSRIAIQAYTVDMENITVNRLIVKNGGTLADSATWTNNIQVKRWSTFSLKDVWLTNLYCEYAASDGVNYGDNIIVESYGSDGNGTLTNVIISNCILKKTGRNNLSIAGDNTASRPNYVTISNVICEDSSLAGIDFEEANKVTANNIHFINSGRYSAYYNGSHFAQLNPNTVMRSGVSLHGANEGILSNSTFTSCYYGLGGFGTGLNVNNCKFFDSKITNGDLSAAGRWLISNCDISGTGTQDYLVSSFLGRLIFSHCNFSGTTSSTYLVKLTSDGSSDTYYRENCFSNCVFIGQTARTMNVFYIQYGTYEVSDNIFNDFGTIFTFYQSSGLVQIDIESNQIRRTNLIISAGYISLSSLNFKNNFCELIKQIATFNTQTRDMLFSDNTCYFDLNTGDGLTHIGLDFPTACGVKNLKFVDNYMHNKGTATDVELARFNVRSQEVATDTLNISNNTFVNALKGFGVYLYASSTLAVNATITNNQGKGVTTLLSDIAGVDANKSVVKDNLNEGALVTTHYPRISGTTAQRPTNVLAGYRYYDTTTTTSIVWTGSAWA